MKYFMLIQVYCTDDLVAVCGYVKALFSQTIILMTICTRVWGMLGTILF